MRKSSQIDDYSFRDLLSPSSAFGIAQSEKAFRFPSDKYFDGTQAQLFRGISISAPKELIFSWLCQMRKAPYSYDWIDNLGRKSPRKRDESLCDLSLGDRFMYIFNLAEFEQNSFISITGTFSRLVARQFYVDYLIAPDLDALLTLSLVPKS